ncbi:caveolin-3-like [Mercenaria mercenaria]|uniref:caveolin-3-like n=1 Tax=Mercenaria mercenaria TaxID=6596 RepID=UPI001E1D55D4|nr:caveolin-3-like [Mercenaria mercenaria]
MSVDLINRDPNCINSHIQCAFEDVLAEPEGVQSIDCVWKLSYSCFECWKNLCYKLTTLLCGCCIAASWGCEFASVAFLHVWQFTPTLKVLQINCTYYRKWWSLILSCCVDPCCISCGQIFHAFKREK